MAESARVRVRARGTSASTIALILGATPIFAATIGIPFGLERALSRRFWLAAVISFAGVGLVAASASGLGGDLRGTALGIAGGHVGGLLGRDRALDGPLLGVPDQRGGAASGMGADRTRRLAAGGGAGLRPRLGGVGAARLRDAGAARPHERALVPLLHRIGLALPPRRRPAAVRGGRVRADPPFRADDVGSGRRRR